MAQRTRKRIWSGIFIFAMLIAVTISAIRLENVIPEWRKVRTPTLTNDEFGKIPGLINKNHCKVFSPLNSTIDCSYSVKIHDDYKLYQIMYPVITRENKLILLAYFIESKIDNKRFVVNLRCHNYISEDYCVMNYIMVRNIPEATVLGDNQIVKQNAFSQVDFDTDAGEELFSADSKNQTNLAKTTKQVLDIIKTELASVRQEDLAAGLIILNQPRIPTVEEVNQILQ